MTRLGIDQWSSEMNEVSDVGLWRGYSTEDWIKRITPYPTPWVKGVECLNDTTPVEVQDETQNLSSEIVVA